MANQVFHTRTQALLQAIRIEGANFTRLDAGMFHKSFAQPSTLISQTADHLMIVQQEGADRFNASGRKDDISANRQDCLLATEIADLKSCDLLLGAQI